MNNLQEQGRALYKRGEYQKAIGVFDRAIGRAASVQLLDNRAACYEKLGELSSALKDAKKAIQLQREDATGYLRAGEVLVKMEKESVALEIYTHGLKCIKHVGQGYELLRKSHKDLMDKLSPPTSVDPLTVLPRELAEMILEYLTFRQRINACQVTKQWAHFIRSSPNLWAYLDLIGARKKVPSKFISRAINVARTKLTAARLNNLYDFEKTVRALVKTCPLEELTLIKCGLQGQHLTDALANAKHLKIFSLGRDSELQPYQLQHLLTAVSERIESFHCNISRGGIATIDGASCKNLKMLSLSFPNPAGLTSLLANISTCLPNLQSLMLRQTETNSSFRTGMHMDLDKCDHLQSVDLSLAFSSTSLLTLPQSLRIVKLNPMLVSNPEHFFRPMSMGLQSQYGLPNMQELRIDLPRLAIHRASYMLEGNNDIEMTSDGLAIRSKLRKLAIIGATVDDVKLVEILQHDRLLDLEMLSLAACHGCDDKSVLLITRFSQKLTTLDLSETDITGVGVKQALELKNFRRLIVNDCRRIGTDAIDWARSRGIQVEYRMSENLSGGNKTRY